MALITVPEVKVNWSFSSLIVYEECPLRFKFSRIDRIPEPEQPPDNPVERGNRIHKHLERFVKGEIPSLSGCEAKAIAKFEPLLQHARDLYADGKASVEENWWFDKDWDVCDRESVWLWSKLDLNVTDQNVNLIVPVDYKSGKSGYKTIVHMQQLQLYAAIAALRNPWAEWLNPEIWYLDEGTITPQTYTREQALRFVGRFDMRAKAIYNDKFFKPNPNKVTCRYCPYSPRGNGHCPVGV